MDKNDYIPRISDAMLERYLATFGAVVIVGCKWCGKTTSANQFAKSVIKLQDPDNIETYMSLAATKPSLLLRGDKPRLLDEWQDIPEIWDSVRHDVDKTNLLGQYLLTGSYTPRDRSPKHPGTGRFGKLTMNPMTLSESGESSNEISLSDLVDEKDIEGISNLDIEDYAYLCCRGGWPGALRLFKENALLVAKQYIASLTEEDVHKIATVEKNPKRALAVLKSLARNDCTDVKLPTLKNDALVNGKTMDERVISEYLDAYDRLYITFDVDAFSPNLRSKRVIRTSKKKYFIDPSLAIAALNASPEQLLTDIRTYGFIFENLCMRDLKVYTEACDAKINYYKDSAGLEIDAIIVFNDSEWGAIEIKLGGDEAIEQAAKNLKQFADSIDDSLTSKPKFLAVITGSTYAFQREDGVYVVPIGCLKS